MYSKLQYISQGKTADEQFENIQNALDGGCQWVQLRFKNAGLAELNVLANKVKKVCTAYKATFIMNDHPDIAKASDADGVHLGLADMHVTDARQILGPNKIIGGTANTVNDVLKRINENCNYIGLGPFRFTSTKEKLSPILGIEGLARVIKETGNGGLPVPVYAIGGITLDDIPEIMHTGVYGIAVSGAFTNYPDKNEWIQKFNIITNGQTNYCR